VIRRPARLLALGLLLALTGCASSGPAPEPTPAPPPLSPFAGATLWVDEQSTAQREADKLREQGDDAAAAAFDPITSQPVATWFSGQEDNPYETAERVTTEAAAQGKLPVLVAYHRPGRDCGSYSAGGSSDAETYLQWTGQLAAGVGDRPALVVLEPDAVAQAATGACTTPEQAAADYAMLAQAVDVLKKQPNLRVYLDAGHSDWVGDKATLAEALQSSGIERADGFALNVSNFQPTADSLAYGESLSPLLGRPTQFVVDVSRNGQGAPPGVEGIDAWCNPPSAGLGENPRLVEGPALAVGLLWIKEPGASDGDCRPGEPAAGTFWPEYAEGLIEQRS
jgi:endoglucanase